jgi:beta-phosphoglucomutase-like phosphatase (HAD superfamily)
MFDVDGTLVESADFDFSCFIAAIKTVLGIDIDHDMSRYEHVTHAGIMNQIMHPETPRTQRLQLTAEVKAQFVSNIRHFIREHRVKAIPGAAEFLKTLRTEQGVSLSIATGGWYETAIMKLDAAGIDVSDLPVATSNDHYDRSAIMQIAMQRSGGDDTTPCTYFGDGSWDKAACQQLGYNFILIGDRATNDQRLDNFTQIEMALDYLSIQKHYSLPAQSVDLTHTPKHG